MVPRPVHELRSADHGVAWILSTMDPPRGLPCVTLAGIPALKVPDNWPHYDVIAQPVRLPAQRISVKSRTYKTGPAYVNYNSYDQIDWLAIVILGEADRDPRSIYVVPRTKADSLARQDKPASKTAALRYFRIDEVERLFETYRSNFSLFSA